MTDNIQLYDVDKYGFKAVGKSMFGDSDAFQIDEKAAFDTSTAGINNEIYGAVIFNQVNLEARGYGVLPKVDATAQGMNAQSFRVADNQASISHPAEGGSVGTAQTFNTLEGEPEVKTSELVMEATSIQSIESQLASEDDVSFDTLKALGNAQILNQVESSGILRSVEVGTTPAYSADNAPTPLDRVISNADEEGNADDTSGTLLTDGDMDVYSFDRSAGEFEAFVSHNSGTDRNLTEDLMDGALGDWEAFGNGSWEDAVLLTGYDTASELSAIQQDNAGAFRFDVNPAVGRENVNDAETQYGSEGIFKLRNYKGIPVVASGNVPSHGSLSDIYILDFSESDAYGPDGVTRPKIYVENYTAPQFYEAGHGHQANPLTIGEYKDKAAWVHYHELVCVDAGSQGKIRDLQSA